MKKLQKQGKIDPHDLKDKSGKSSSDIWKDRDGNLYRGPHKQDGGDTQLDPLYENMNDPLLA